MKLLITTCPTCGSKNLKLVKRTWKGEAEGEKYTVPRLEFYECPDCGEQLFDREAMRQIQAVSPAYRQQTGKHTSKGVGTQQCKQP